MKKLSCLGLIAIILFSALSLQNASAGEWDLIAPENGKKTKLEVAGNSFTYWELSKKSAVKVDLTGPTTLKVYTRAAIPGNKRDILYGLIVNRDESERYFVGRGSSRDKDVKNLKDGSKRIADDRSFIFDVPEGKHTYSFLLPDQVEDDVYVRFLIPKDNDEEEINYIAFLPRSFWEEVVVTVKEREYIYYRVNDGKPIELDVIGATKIRGIARLEFDHSIRGDKPYRIQIKEDGRVINTYPQMASISSTASYRITNAAKVLGKGDSFYINVPEGHHRYEVTIPDPGIDVIFRFYIPQKDLGNSRSESNFNRADADLIRGIFNGNG